MDDSVISTYLLEDSLFSEDLFSPEQLLGNENDQSYDNSSVSDTLSVDKNTSIDCSELILENKDDEELGQSDSEGNFNLNLDDEDRVDYPNYIEDEARLISFSFSKTGHSSEEIAKEKMKILKKYDGEYNADYLQEGNMPRKSTKPIIHYCFDVPSRPVSPTKFSFKVKNTNTELPIKGRVKKRSGRLSVAEKFWKDKIVPGRVYLVEEIKRCIDVMVIHGAEYIITRLIDGSMVPIPWKIFPFLAYNKFWRIKKILKESTTEKRKRQNRRYREIQEDQYDEI